MPLTPLQTKTYWRLFSQAAKAQGKTREAGLTGAEIDAWRHELLVECGVQSMHDLTRTKGFDQWKALCLRLTGDLKGAIEEVDPGIAADRRVRFALRRVLELLVVVLGGEARARGYLLGLTRSRFARLHALNPTLLDFITQSTPQEARALVTTLNARIRGLKLHSTQSPLPK